jgi:integrase
MTIILPAPAGPLARLTRFFRTALKRPRLPGPRLHDLRHAHAILAPRAGVRPKVVSECLGHSTVGVTLDTYSHATRRSRRRQRC